MNRSIHIIQLFGGGVLLLLLTGCIRENRDNCPPETAVRSVVLKVMDTVTGRDITENGEAGGAELYLFAPTGEYAGHVSVTSDEIMHRIPVMLPERNLAGCRISAWTNVGAGQQFHIPDDGSRLENRAVSLFMEDDTYHGVPDNLFFGQLQLASAGTGMPEEVTVVRKNARMHITVRGLDDGVPEERYYFTVQAPNDGYDFNGKPMAGTAVRRAGTFGPNGDFATVGTFNMIHTDTPDDAETGVGVSLYERMTVRSADRLVAAVTTDDDGMPISLPAGQTVNLLIDVGQEAGISVRMEITPWNEVYQWEIW